MVRSARPTQAMTLIGELGLAATVFPAPEHVVVPEAEEGAGGDAAALPGTWCVGSWGVVWCGWVGGWVSLCASDEPTNPR